MVRDIRIAQIAVLLMLLLVPAIAAAQELKDISLPPPQTTGGKPLMQCLTDRRSARPRRRPTTLRRDP